MFASLEILLDNGPNRGFVRGRTRRGLREQKCGDEKTNGDFWQRIHVFDAHDAMTVASWAMPAMGYSAVRGSKKGQY